MKFLRLKKADKNYEGLNPCDDCGNIDIELYHLWDDPEIQFQTDYKDSVMARCPKCGKKTSWYNTDEQARDAWNKKIFYNMKKESAITQPNKPKPTTMLPDNMEWAWDPDAADWVAVLKDNTNTTPPLYNPNNNQTVTNNATTYMSNVKSALQLKDLKDINGKSAEEGMWLYCPMMQPDFRGKVPLYLFQVKVRHSRNGVDTPYLQSKNGGYTKGITYVKKGILFDTYEEAEKYRQEHLSIEEKEYENMSTWDKVKHQLEIYKKSASCLAEFLDGPRYSKEIKIEAGLIKNGLVKYAGFDFNRGTKYAITEKGLKVLRSAAEKEHNEALNEREKLAYMFGFNTDKETTLDTTGKTIKADDKDIIVIDTGSGYLQVFENDDTYDYGGYSVGEQLYEFSINDEDRRNGKATLDVDDLLNSKFYGIIFEDFDKLEWFVQNIKDSNTQQEIKNLLNKEAKGVYSSKNTSNRRYTIIEADGTPLGKVTASSKLDALVKFGIEHPEYTESQSICAKEIEAVNKPFESTMGFYTYEVLWQDNDDKEGEFIEPIRFELCDDRDIDEWSWKCEELFGKEWFYGFLSRKDAMDKVIKELNKWGTIKGEIKQVDSLYTGRLKRLHSNYEQTTDTKEPYPNPSETPHDDIILENHDGWVNTADNHFEYTEEQKRLLPLFKLVNEYVARKQIQLTEDVQNEENTIATGSAEVINELEHKVKDLGFYCEPIAEITDNDDIGQDIYSLKIFTK